MAHSRHFIPDYGRCFQIKVLQTFKVVPCSREEQWGRAVDPTLSRGGLVLAQLAQGLIVGGGPALSRLAFRGPNFARPSEFFSEGSGWEVRGAWG